MTSGELTEAQQRRIQEALETVSTTFGPLETGRARATAGVLSDGRRIVVVSADVVDEARNLAATALSSYLRLPARKAFP